MNQLPLLRRYTDLPSLLAMLKTRAITLLPPSSWDDRNDRYVMDLYKSRRELKTLLALCFSQVPETYHHWRVFAPGNSGVCIEFDHMALVKELAATGVECSSVDYKTTNDVATFQTQLERLPFTKRSAFSDEEEFRVVFASSTVELATKEVPFSLSSINRISINPWLPPPLFTSVKETLLAIGGCANLNISHSQLIDSRLWKAFIERSA